MGDYSFGIIEPGEVRLRSDTGVLDSPNRPYSPKCLEGEGEFWEVCAFSACSATASFEPPRQRVGFLANSTSRGGAQ
jgi:hypothetical protein